MASRDAGDEGRWPSAEALRDDFLAWQCRARQQAVRSSGGRPSAAMRPAVLDADGREMAAAITVLLVPRQPDEAAGAFRHIVRRSHDPRECYGAACKLLAADYYQDSGVFSEVMTALFAADSGLAAALVEAGRCLLDFRQGSRRYRLPCAVARLEPAAAAWQATYWHNAMFNPELPPEPAILAFTPAWTAAEAGRTPPAGVR